MTQGISFVDEVCIDMRAWVGIVPRGIDSKAELLEAVANALRFPTYFGKNWDALSDCLCDLSWLAPRKVDLVHFDMPTLTQRDLKTYVEVLQHAVNETKRHGAYELSVYFPAECSSDAAFQAV